MFPFFFDSTMILLIPGMALALWAQYRVKHTFSKFSEVPSRQGMTGAQVARAILDQNRLDVTVGPDRRQLDGSLRPSRQDAATVRGCLRIPIDRGVGRCRSRSRTRDPTRAPLLSIEDSEQPRPGGELRLYLVLAAFYWPVFSSLRHS